MLGIDNQLSIQEINHLRQVFRADHINTFYDSCFFRIFLRDDDALKALFLCLNGHGQDATDGAQCPIK